MTERVPLDLIGASHGDMVLRLQYSHKDDNWKDVVLPRHFKALETFVANRMGDQGPVAFIDTSSDVETLHFLLSNGSKVALCFPEPQYRRHGLGAEKMTIDAEWILYLAANTSLPLPKIHCYSRDSSDVVPGIELPFVLMDAMREDQDLFEYLKPENELLSDAGQARVYEQIAEFYLQLYHLTGDSIGSIGKDETGKLHATKRPFTKTSYNLADHVLSCPTDIWPKKPFSTSKEYFDFVSQQQISYLWNLRNLNIPRRLNINDGKPELVEVRDEDEKADPEAIARCARLRFRARHGFLQLINELGGTDEYSGPFAPFISEFDLNSMSFDSGLGKVNGITTIPSINFMPRSFLCDPPTWLCLDGTIYQDIELDQLDSFCQLYEKNLPIFLDAMKEVERREAYTLPKGERPLSARMLESWNTNRFWFHYALDNIQDVDQIYYAFLYKLHPDGKPFELTPALEAEMEKYVEHSKRQIEDFDKDLSEFYPINPTADFLQY